MQRCDGQVEAGDWWRWSNFGRLPELHWWRNLVDFGLRIGQRIGQSFLSKCSENIPPRMINEAGFSSVSGSTDDSAISDVTPGSEAKMTKREKAESDMNSAKRSLATLSDSFASFIKSRTESEKEVTDVAKVDDFDKLMDGYEKSKRWHKLVSNDNNLTPNTKETVNQNPEPWQKIAPRIIELDTKENESATKPKQD